MEISSLDLPPPHASEFLDFKCVVYETASGIIWLTQPVALRCIDEIEN